MENLKGRGPGQLDLEGAWENSATQSLTTGKKVFVISYKEAILD